MRISNLMRNPKLQLKIVDLSYFCLELGNFVFHIYGFGRIILHNLWCYLALKLAFGTLGIV